MSLSKRTPGILKSLSTHVLAVTLVCFTTVVMAQKPPGLTALRVATGEWPPFTSEAYYAPFRSYGRVADVVVSSFLEAGYAARVEFHSFGEAYGLANRGPVDAAFPYYHTVERAREMLFSEPLLEAVEVIFYNKNAVADPTGVETLDDLERLLGAEYENKARFVESYCYTPAIHRALNRECVTETGRDRPDWRDLPTEIDAFRALLSDRDVILLPAARQVGERILQTWFNERERTSIGIIPALQWRREIFLVARKGKSGEALIEAFNEGLAKLRRGREYSALVNAALPEESVLRTVRLGDPGTFPLVVARKEPDAEETIVLPRGTTATVVKWSSNFLTPKRTTLQEQLGQMSRVMITNGPQRGQLLWVQNIFIELD